MGRSAYLTVAILLAAAPLAYGQSEERLHPLFVDESLRDPFLTPANSQISGPLDGENPAQDWDRDFQTNPYTPGSPAAVFAEPADCTGTAAAPPRRSPIMDSGVTGTWLAPVDGFGISDVDVRTSLILPLFVKGSPLRLSMSAGSTFVSAPAAIDVPSRLYGLQAELRWYLPLRETWGIDLAAGGGVYSDMNGTASDGFRATGRAILVKEINPQWKVSAGVLYLGRKNLLAMPVAGAIYTPRDDLRVEILIPRPRVLKRIAFNGIREHWIYAGGEVFGGNTWAIQQMNGMQDTFIYKDNRVLVGYETKAPGSISGRLEAGYVFMREVSFEDDPATLDPGGTFMLRAGITY